MRSTDGARLGKTIVALKLITDVCKGKALVVCPAFLRSNWKEEIDKFVDSPKIEVVSYSQLDKVKSDIKYDIIIFDEAHYIKNPSSARSQRAVNLVYKLKPSYCMLLSGTPIKNRIPDLWNLLKVCYISGQYPEFEKYYSSQTRFNHTFCYERSFFANGFAFRRFEGLKPNKVQELKDLIRPVYHRKKLKDVEIELPEQTYKYIQTKDKNEYDRALIDAFEAFETNRDDAAFMTIKSANALAKTKYTIELAQELIDEGKQPTIFTYHKASCEEIAKKFKVPHIHGGVNPDKRAGIINEFKAGKYNVLVATIGSLSVGVNLTNTSYMIFNDISWNQSDQDQTEKRIHRVGQKSNCFYYYIFSSKIDQMIYQKVREKRKVIDRVEDEQTN